MVQGHPNSDTDLRAHPIVHMSELFPCWRHSFTVIFVSLLYSACYLVVAFICPHDPGWRNLWLK